MLRHIFLKFSMLYETTICFFFLIFERLGRMHENKILFFLVFSDICIYIFVTFHRKSGILIPDLYFYNIKIQTLK